MRSSSASFNPVPLAVYRKMLSRNALGRLAIPRGYMIPMIFLLFFFATQHYVMSRVTPSPQYAAATHTPNATDPLAQFAFYDPALALNVPSFTHDLQPPFPPQSTHTLPAPPLSLVSFYRTLHNTCEKQPYLPDVRLAMEQHTASLTVPQPDLSADDILVVHLVSIAAPAAATATLSDDFVTQAVFLAQQFRHAILLPQAVHGATLDTQYADIALLSSRLRAANITVSVLPIAHPDDSARYMASSKHLLVHRGAQSALGALLCRGMVYHTPDIAEYFDRNAFSWMVNAHIPAMPAFLRGEYRLMLDGMGAVQPSCCRFEAFGNGDGEKIICANARSFEQVADETSPCWVLSLGCGGIWDFEIAIAERTTCHIHTFDCTNKFEIPEQLKGRVTLHELCLGLSTDERPNYISWSDVLDIGEKQSGSRVPRAPAIAKMDIEGWEFLIMKEMLNMLEDEHLPEQIAMEIHTNGAWDVGGKDREREAIGEWFGNLSRVGYQLVHRADNPFCINCAEVTLVRSDGLPRVK